MIRSSSTVANTIASSMSVRTVDTSVPGWIGMMLTAGVASQNVTGTRAGVGGSSRTPISSRNLM